MKPLEPRVLYISGPYRAKTLSGVYDNILTARRWAKYYWEKGYVVLCPHMNSAFMDGENTDAQFLEGDLRLLERTDAIVMIPGWKNSVGAKAELEHAKNLGMKVIYAK